MPDDPRDPSGRPLVMVVDDEPELRGLTECVLASHGYRVVLAANGEEAMQRLSEYCPDLIVLDLNMPVMDGWEFRRAQRHLADLTLAAVPVLVLTACADPARHAAALHAAAVLRKPFDPDQLLSAVSAAMAGAA